MKPLLLHVDDDDLLAYLVQREIRQFEVRRVAGGQDAIDYLNRNGAFHNAARPVLVLLDLHMPNKDGFATLTEIRANPALATLPIVMFTTSQDPADRQRAFALGADHFIQKPSGLEGFTELAATLAGIVNTSGASA